MTQRICDTFANNSSGRLSRLRQFARDEDGALIILSLQVFIIMLVVTGVAI